MLVCGGCVTLIIILIMNRDYPLVGHDYRYFIPRLIDTHLHIRLNGLSIQWYTPSFGGGLPAFPNPQHVQYSIVQWLTFFMNPWLAILLSTAGISLIGYVFFYKFLHQKLELDWMSSTLGAMFFLGNGFFIEHLIVGHLGYQLFPLVAIIIYALVDTRNTVLFNAALISVAIALITHQAGFYLLVISVLSLSITLPLLYLYKPLIFNLKMIVWTVILSMILFIAMVASKVFAIYAFMLHFPRHLSDAYDVSIWQGLIGLAVQLFGVMILTPFAVLTQQPPQFLPVFLSKITGAEYGIWEIDMGLSPVLTGLLVLGLFRAIRHAIQKPQLTRSQVLSLVLLGLAILVTVEMTLAKGTLFALIQQLPFLRSLHVNVRFAAAFIVPLTVLGTLQMSHYLFRNPKPGYFYAGALLTCVCLLSYFSFSGEVHRRNFSVHASESLNRQIQSGATFPVVTIIDTAVTEREGFSEHSSLYQPYEPIFGYFLEYFKPKIRPGKIREVNGGYYNMTNPASYVFPEVNELEPFERIKVSERDKLELFLARRQPEWKIPFRQKILNLVSLIAVISGVGVLITTKVQEIVSMVKQKNTR